MSFMEGVRRSGEDVQVLMKMPRTRRERGRMLRGGGRRMVVFVFVSGEEEVCEVFPRCVAGTVVMCIACLGVVFDERLLECKSEAKGLTDFANLDILTAIGLAIVCCSFLH
jgi:hypothetical protein